MIRFKCENCGRGIKTDDAMANQQGACPGCHQVVQIPSQSMADDLSRSAAIPTKSQSSSEDDGFWQSRAGTVFTLVCVTFVLPLFLGTCLFGGVIVAVLSYIQFDATKKQNVEIEQLEAQLQQLTVPQRTDYGWQISGTRRP